MAERTVETPDGFVAVELDRTQFADGRAMIAEGERQAQAKAGTRKLVGTMGVKANGETVTLTFPLVPEQG